MMKTAQIFVLAAFVFSFACWIGNWSENNTLRETVAEREEQLRKMRAEHELAMRAAAEAMRAREEVHEYQRERMREAGRVLDNNSDFCAQPVPDELRLLWQGGNCEKDSAANGACGGH